MEKIQPPERDAASEFPFAVSVGQVYDGPLDLLLDLVRSRTSTL